MPSGKRTPSCSTKERTGKLPSTRTRQTVSSPFAETAKHYQKCFGDVGDVLGSIAAKNHRNGVANPYAQLRKDLGEEFCQTVSDKNPVVAEPLRRTDCSPVSDGAAAVVLSTEAPCSGAAVAAVRLAGFGHVNDFMPSEKRDPTAFAGSRAALQRALGMAGVAWEIWIWPRCMTASPSPS